MTGGVEGVLSFDICFYRDNKDMDICTFLVLSFLFNIVWCRMWQSSSEYIGISCSV